MEPAMTSWLVYDLASSIITIRRRTELYAPCFGILQYDIYGLDSTTSKIATKHPSCDWHNYITLEYTCSKTPHPKHSRFAEPCRAQEELCNLGSSKFTPGHIDYESSPFGSISAFYSLQFLPKQSLLPYFAHGYIDIDLRLFESLAKPAPVPIEESLEWSHCVFGGQEDLILSLSNILYQRRYAYISLRIARRTEPGDNFANYTFDGTGKKEVWYMLVDWSFASVVAYVVDLLRTLGSEVGSWERLEELTMMNRRTVGARIERIEPQPMSNSIFHFIKLDNVLPVGAFGSLTDTHVSSYHASLNVWLKSVDSMDLPLFQSATQEVF
ncbi:uncharacterized protein BDR25DRAFT_361084 [Lindgomyces ingoldianus]|uniref:Uncharacterized protein n=1 Tax=Lindgomyces ingoldianus TaxID=673940 RepID=A0ACB6QFD1_9PLEO|nr:uncharacterized protein BDR25DRAFT_361084 [Lindgomyces ingoldianus]KAF2464855.1 hypothetical protein BDR25DRAFT_361084 [Lindgomyces ingoldianus]